MTTIALLTVLALPAAAQVVSETSFAPATTNGERFGQAVAALGDLDCDGVGDVAVGSPGHGSGAGSVLVAFLAGDGSARSFVEIGPGLGGFTGVVQAGDAFGQSLANLGDRDGDGLPELAVGAPGDDDAGPDAGAVWVLHLRADGTTGSQGKITSGQGGFGEPLAALGRFGHALAAGDDLDGDGNQDLVVSALEADQVGKLWLLSLDAEASVLASSLVTTGTAGFSGMPPLDSEFGASVAMVGDVDANGSCDLAVGAPSGNATGRIWLLFLDGPGLVVSHRVLKLFAIRSGVSLAPLGDLDGNGTPDLVSGAGVVAGAALALVFLSPSGAPVGSASIGTGLGGFEAASYGIRSLGAAVAFDDLDGDGRGDWLVGAPEIVGAPLAQGGRAWFLRGSPPPFVHATPTVFDALIPGSAATLMLEGSGFSAASTVTIGGLAVEPSRVVVESSTLLRVDLPQLPALGRFEVSVAPGGGSAPGFDVIDVVAPAGPVLQIDAGDVGGLFANIVYASEGLEVTVAGSPGETHHVLYSAYALPSVVPGLVELDIGDAFTSLELATTLTVSPAGWARTTLALPNASAFWHLQGVTLDPGRPFPASNLQSILVLPR